MFLNSVVIYCYGYRLYHKASLEKLYLASVHTTSTKKMLKWYFVTFAIIIAVVRNFQYDVSH